MSRNRDNSSKHQNITLNDRIEKARYHATLDNTVIVIEYEGRRIPVMPNPPKHLLPGYSPSIIEELNRGD